MKLIVEIEKLDHFGRGIAKKDGKPIFVVDALPSETVEVVITNDKKKFMEGKVVKYLNQSEIRNKPICPYYDECGGCDIMHLSYAEQLNYKENKVKEVLNKFASITCVQPIVGSRELFYRNKITLQVKEVIGLYKKKSYEIVPIDKCYIVDKRINEIISLIKTINLKNIKQIVIRVTNNESMIIFYVTDSIKIDINQFASISTVIVINNDFKEVLKGNGYIVEELLGLKFIISPTSFFQVNPLGMTNLYNQVLKYANLSGQERVLDLYCGTGTIGLFLANKCSNVLGIEINKEAIKDALDNKKINNISNIDFKSGDVGKVLNNTNFKADLIIVDPPRSGLDSNTINKIIELNPNKLIYVSCDVVTLARDLNILKNYFNINEITPIDMFSNTYHVECVCVLKNLQL